MPPDALELYAPALSTLQNIQLHGLPPDEVAKRVEHALMARRPQARYPVGRNARVFGLIRHLPVRLRDRLIARRLRNNE